MRYRNLPIGGKQTIVAVVLIIGVIVVGAAAYQYSRDTDHGTAPVLGEEAPPELTQAAERFLQSALQPELLPTTPSFFESSTEEQRPGREYVATWTQGLATFSALAVANEESGAPVYMRVWTFLPDGALNEQTAMQHAATIFSEGFLSPLDPVMCDTQPGQQEADTTVCTAWRDGFDEDVPMDATGFSVQQPVVFPDGATATFVAACFVPADQVIFYGYEGCI